MHNGWEASPETAQRIDDAVRGIVHSAFERSTAILRDNRVTLDRTARALLAKETLEEPDIIDLTSDLKRIA